MKQRKQRNGVVAFVVDEAFSTIVHRFLLCHWSTLLSPYLVDWKELQLIIAQTKIKNRINK